MRFNSKAEQLVQEAIQTAGQLLQPTIDTLLLHTNRPIHCDLVFQIAVNYLLHYFQTQEEDFLKRISKTTFVTGCILKIKEARNILRKQEHEFINKLSRDLADTDIDSALLRRRLPFYLQKIPFEWTGKGLLYATFECILFQPMFSPNTLRASKLERQELEHLLEMKMLRQERDEYKRLYEEYIAKHDKKIDVFFNQFCMVPPLTR